MADVILAFDRDHVYPKLVTPLRSPKPIPELRRRILPTATGYVLEVGFGGCELAYYDAAKITRLCALEPMKA